MKLWEFLDLFEFHYEKSNGVYHLIDNQGANLGDIDEEEFNSIAEIVDRLDIYYTDYIYETLCDKSFGVGYDGIEDYVEILCWLRENYPTYYAIPYIECIVNPDLIYESEV